MSTPIGFKIPAAGVERKCKHCNEPRQQMWRYSDGAYVCQDCITRKRRERLSGGDN